MNIESRLALEILSDSKLNSYQRRYNAVIKFIEIYDIVPSFERIIDGLPKSESIMRNVLPDKNLLDDINYYEDLLAEEPENIQIINKLDELYDADYHLRKK